MVLRWPPLEEGVESTWRRVETAGVPPTPPHLAPNPTPLHSTHLPARTVEGTRVGTDPQVATPGPHSRWVQTGNKWGAQGTPHPTEQKPTHSQSHLLPAATPKGSGDRPAFRPSPSRASSIPNSHTPILGSRVPSHCTCFRRGTWSRQGPSAAPAWASGSSSKEGSVPLQECQQVRKGDPTPLPEDLSAGRVEDGSGPVPPSCPMAGPHGSGQAAAPVPPSRVLSRPALGR